VRAGRKIDERVVRFTHTANVDNGVLRGRLDALGVSLVELGEKRKRCKRREEEETAAHGHTQYDNKSGRKATQKAKKEALPWSINWSDQDN
jgi:hypothetical protein